MSAVESAEVEQPKPSRAWMWVLGLISLLLVGFSFAKQGEVGGGIAYGVGFWLVPTAIVALLFCLIFSASRAHPGIVFGALYGCAIAGHVIGHQSGAQEALQAIDSMRAAMNSYTDQMNLGGASTQIELQPATATTKGDAGVMELLSKQFINDAAAQHNEYLQALETAGWPKLLAAERLKNDPTLKESRAIIEASRVIVKQYRQKAVELLSSLPERARQAPFRSSVRRRDFLRGIEEGNVVHLANNARNWDYEEAIMAEYIGAIELLATIPGRYQFDDHGNILFETDQAIETFNGYLDKADELIKAQAEAAKEQQTAAFKKLDAARDKVAH